VSAAEFHPFNGPKPIAVLIQSDPWSMVMGADNPRFVVYEDGTAIFVKASKDGAKYFTKKFSEVELSEFEKHLSPVLDLKTPKHFYNLRPNVTDQPEAEFYIKDGGGELATRIYGLKSSGTNTFPYTITPGRHKPDEVPEALLVLHKYLCSIEYPDVTEWHPKYVEVMIWPYEYAPEASIIWPKSWPALDSERTVKRGDSYSIFLEGNIMQELQKFLRTEKEKGAVEIGGKKWAVSVRYVFPSEPVWRNALEQTHGK